MAEHTRRTFLRTAGIGVAAAGATTVIPAEIAEAATPQAADLEVAASEVPAGTSLVAHVTDAKAGRIALLIGDREVVITDRALTARLLRAVR